MAYPDANDDWRNFLDAEPEWKALAKTLPRLADAGDRDRTIVVIAATLGVFDSLLLDRAPLGRGEHLDHLAAAFRSAMEVPPQNLPTEAVGLTACAVLLASTGYEIELGSLLEARIDGVLERDIDTWNRDRTQLALASLACGLDERASELLGAADDYEPGTDFGLDTDHFIRETLGASVQGLDQTTFEPTWRSYCDVFPAHFQTGGAQLPDLLFAAYAVYTRIYRVLPADVFAALHSYLHDTYLHHSAP